MLNQCFVCGCKVCHTHLAELAQGLIVELLEEVREIPALEWGMIEGGEILAWGSLLRAAR
jgi:hypothetical protein